MYSDECFNYFKKVIKKSPDKYLEDYNKIYDQVQKSSAIYQGEPIDFLYQPMFYNINDVNKLENICIQLVEIINKITQEYKNNSSFRNYFGFPELMEELILTDPGYNQNFPIARFDLFYSENSIKFCELNTDGTSAMNEARVLQNLFLKSEIIKEMQKKYKFDIYELFYSWIDKVTANYREYADRPKNNPNIAIIDFAGEGTINEFQEFKKRFNKRGYNTVICDPGELNYIDGTLYFKETPLDIIYRRATTSRLIEEADNIEDLIKAYKNHDICMIGGFVSQIPHNKIIFSILHDRNKVSFLTEEEYEFIKKHIPYTMVFDYENKNLRKKVLQNREKYILKPCDWFACHGVYVGKDYTPQKWEKLLEELRDKNYIVQEFCEVPDRKMLNIINNNNNSKKERIEFKKFNYLTGLFLYNQELSGIYTRAGRKNIIGSIVESFTLPSFISQKRR
ncbi:MAG: glutathionylspermidine synthase family protein [Bacillota bacterium]